MSLLGLLFGGSCLSIGLGGRAVRDMDVGGFLKIRGNYLIGSPRNRDYNIGIYIRVPYFGKLPCF